MADNNEKLTAKQEGLIAALLGSPTIQQAAVAAGVSERQAYRWMRDDAAFDAAYRAARRQAVQQAIARLQQHSGVAVTILLGIAADKNAPSSSRVAAASKVLDLAIRVTEFEQLEARVQELEAALKEQHS